MPTARELLEQADALMRRNRAASAAVEGARPAAPPPLNAPSVAPGLVSPRTIQREPIAPSVARVALPVDPSESPLIVPEPAVRSDAPEPSARDGDGGLPVLTDAVNDAAATPATFDDLDDVPVLTDAVEEIDVTVVEEPTEVDTAARGEPSYWLAGEASVLGAGPDSVAVVPAPDVAEVPQTPPPGRDPLGLDQPAPGFAPLPAAEGGPIETASITLEDDWVVPPGEEADAAASEPAPVPESVFETEPAMAREPALEPEPASEPSVPEPAPSADMPLAAVATGASLVVPSAEQDEARIREIAEEIGMQVLQRIDIFADTGLREKLGERLRPVVDRIGAELVDALNQHVGELLRAYVAEAIEREIETWRERRGP